MTTDIELLHLRRNEPPRLLLTAGGQGISLSWHEWQELVHRASWLYVRWCAEYDVDLVNEGDRLAGAAAGATLGHHDAERTS